ncbi:hypothetical protein [Pectobacterium versatile]|uniref:hypothetical protein n=1 Tax=Pectobacterium versatile TaxID=2488639 RepID=UPI001CD00497|nr:hypothetical protein [Pectobacterium versatile]
MKIPSRQECYEIFDKYSVPSPIRRHCEKVTDVGGLLGKRLQEAGVEVDMNLLEAGCLLHDAFKAASLKSLEPRPEWGYAPSEREIEIWSELRERYEGMHETLIVAEIFKDEYPEFSNFLKMIGSTGNPSYLLGGVELKVLHYADWRVQLVDIVSFDDRLAYLRETYRESWEKHGISWDERYDQEKRLEKEIFIHLDFGPDNLNTELENAPQVAIEGKY